MGVARVRSASSAAVAPAAAAVALTCSLASGAVVAVHARHTVTPMHVAQKSGEASGLLPVQRSTSYNLGRGRKGPTMYGGRLQVHFPEVQVPGGSGKVRTHLPSTRKFLIPNLCHLGADRASGNRWAGRRCVKPHGREFGC